MSQPNLLQPRIELATLALNERLAVPDTSILAVHSVERGIASSIALAPDGERIEFGVVGREGRSIDVSIVLVSDTGACGAGRNPRILPEYRALLLTGDGRIAGTEKPIGQNDGDALHAAAALADTYAVDLRDGLRFIEHFEPTSMSGVAGR